MKSFRVNNRVLILLITLLAFALRAYRLDAQAIWWDESLSVYRATRDLATILANTIQIQNIITTDLMPPLYFMLLHFLVPAFGISEFALRFLSLAANVATVPLIYALARRWFTSNSSPVVRGRGEGVGVFAACFAALSPFYIAFAQEARPYALVLFFSTLAIYALARAFELRIPHYELRITFYDLRWHLIYILSAIAALYTHYYAIFLLPFHAILIALCVWRAARAWILLPAIPAASAIFLASLVLSGAAGNVNRGPTFVPLDVILRDLVNSFSVGITADAAQMLWIELALLAFFVIGIVANSKLKIQNSDRIANYELRITISLLAYLAIPIIGLQLASLARPLYQNSRYFITISPAFYIGIAASARRWKILALPALAIFLIGALASLNNLYFDPRWGKDDHRAWAEDLRARARPGDFLILDSPRAEELYRYYAGDSVPMTTLPILLAGETTSPEADGAAVRDALQKYARVWFLEIHVPFNDPDARVEKILNQEGVLLDQVHFRGTSTKLALSLFVPTFPVANSSEIPHPLDLAFAGHLRLRGYDASGARGIVKLFWQIDEPVGEDYAISLRLVDETGARAGQWDATPLGNRAGSSTWEPKKIIVDTRDLVGTRPGKYQIQVVPYHAATGNALGDVVTLGEIQMGAP